MAENRDSLEALERDVARREEALRAAAPPAGLEVETALDTLLRTLARLRRRLRQGPDAPLWIALFGPTGAGKSKLFSSLAGEAASEAGFRRPWTRETVFWLHEDDARLREDVDGRVVLHRQAAWRRAMLIDTPDFDSVEAPNRAEAEHVFQETDAFLFVTDALKYADASTWEYLARIRASGKPFVVVLNRVESEELAGDFERRSVRRFGEDAPRAQVVVPELPIDDATPIPAGHPALVELRARIDALLGPPEGDRQRSASRAAAEAVQAAELAREIRGRATARRGELARLGERLRERAEEEAARLERRLSTEIDPAVKGEVYRRVLERLERFDILRYPRRLLALPVEGVRSLVGRWRPGGGAAGAEPGAEEEPEVASTAAQSEAFQLLESSVIALGEAVRRDWEASEALGGRIPRDEWRTLRPRHEELVRLYDERHAGFREWAAREARETASQLTGQSKLKFILSQVLFNSVLIGAQVQTGGGFTLLEFAFDGVLSPLVAKAVGMAVSSERVRAFEEQAREAHRRLLLEVLDEARGRLAARLEQAGKGLDDFEAALAGVEALGPDAERIVRSLAEGPSASRAPPPRDGDAAAGRGGAGPAEGRST